MIPPLCNILYRHCNIKPSFYAYSAVKGGFALDSIRRIRELERGFWTVYLCAGFVLQVDFFSACRVQLSPLPFYVLLCIVGATSGVAVYLWRGLSPLSWVVDVKLSVVNALKSPLRIVYRKGLDYFLE